MIILNKNLFSDAKWHTRENVKKSLTFAKYKPQKTAATKVDRNCKGVEKGQSLSEDFNVESEELAYIIIPGRFAIAHHLISSWADQVVDNGYAGSSLSNL